MPYCSQWVIEKHTRPRPTHHCAYFLPHQRLVAMDRTFLASRLLCTEPTTGKPCMRIIHKFKVFIVHTIQPQLMLAVEFHHPCNNTFFTFNTPHTYIIIPTANLQQYFHSSCRQNRNIPCTPHIHCKIKV